MRKTALSLLAFTLVCGCGLKSVDESREISMERWSADRAKLLHELAVQDHQVGKLPAAEKKLTEAVKIDPDNRAYRAFLARVYSEQGKFDSARRVLRKLHEDDPRSADVAYLLGVVAEKQNRLAEAIEHYRLAARLDEAAITPVTAAAEVLVSLGRTEEAWEYLAARMDRGDDEAAKFEIAGRIGMRVKRYRKAAEYFQEARLLDIKNPGYSKMIAEAEYYAGRLEEALRWIEIVRKHEEYAPDFATESMRAECLLALGQPRPAAAAFRDALAADADNPRGWNGVAKAMLIVGDYPEVIRAANKSRAIEPQNADAALLLTAALIRQERYPEAQRVLDAAARRHPQHHVLYKLKGKICEKSGDRAGARRNYAVARNLAMIDEK